jgi:hypothetical protein
MIKLPNITILIKFIFYNIYREFSDIAMNKMLLRSQNIAKQFSFLQEISLDQMLSAF